MLTQPGFRESSLTRALPFHTARTAMMTSSQGQMKSRKAASQFMVLQLWAHPAPKSRAYGCSLMSKYPPRSAEPFFLEMALPCGSSQWSAAKLESCGWFCKVRCGCLHYCRPKERHLRNHAPSPQSQTLLELTRGLTRKAPRHCLVLCCVVATDSSVL